MPDALRRAVLLLMLLLSPDYCWNARAENQEATLSIAAAADLQPVLPVILAEYKRQTGRSVDASYASSATLVSQIENGAPFDLFLSADMSFPEKLIGDRFGTDPQPTPYARGTLVLWSRKDSHLGPPTMKLLKAPALQSVAVANPEHAPYGRAAFAALHQLTDFDSIQPKLRVAENIAQAAQYAESGNADIGLISLTSALTPRLQAEGQYVEVPTSAYPPILQGALVLSHSAHQQAARAFLRYLTSASVSRELTARGLKPPN